MSRAEFYRLVSGTLRQTIDTAPLQEHQALARIAHALAQAFAQRNTKFDPARFLRDCGIGDPLTKGN